MDWAFHMQRILTQLGEDAVCTHGTGAPATVRGMFLQPFRDIQGNMIEASDPRFAGLTTDLATITHGDTVVRGGITYTVGGVEPDGVSGITELRLTV